MRRTLRMTLGSASPARSSCSPSDGHRPGSRLHGCAARRTMHSASGRKCVKACSILSRDSFIHCAAAKCASAAARSAGSQLGRGHFHHAAEQALLRPAAQQHRAIARSTQKHVSVASRPARSGPLHAAGYRRCRRAVAGSASFHGQMQAIRRLRRADRRAEVHQRLQRNRRPIARNQMRARAPDFGFASGKGVSTAHRARV